MLPLCRVSRRTLPAFFALLTSAAVALAACGGGGGGGGSSVPAVSQTAAATSTPTPVTSQSQQISTSTTSPQTASYAVSGAASSVTVPIGSVATTLTTTFTTSQPGSTPTIQNLHRRPQNIGASPIGALAFLCVTPAASLTLAAFPSFALTFSSSFAGQFVYAAFYDPTNSAAGWNTVEGPASGSGLTLTLTGGVPGPTLQGGQTYCFLFFTLASALPTPTPKPTATASPTATPTATPTSNAATAFTCPTSDSSLNSIARSNAAGGTDAARRSFGLRVQRTANTQKIESITTTRERRYLTSVAMPYWPDDPYFDGFTAAQNLAAGNPAPSTYQAAPYAESTNVPGQWDMHAIGLGYALEYSQTANGSGIVNAGALGSPAIKIAIIDTGEDPNHPDLTSKIAYQKCFITSADGTQQSTSLFETDPLGHGTNVAGIAAADMNNGLGFVGAGGNVVIYAYRVFPTPDDNCSNENTTDPQCGADPIDIAAAINDAVTQGVNVISMSLGGGRCTNGVDSDPHENAAVVNAVNHNVIVVAASGNSGGSNVLAPACDAGVIAVGATGLSDGSPNGSGNSSGTALNPREYVANYTQYGSINAFHSATSWGIVAPGGDPSTNSDSDNLHWIENIWTTTPYQSDVCHDDYPFSTSVIAPVDCRVLIAGTSMATPHVAGAAALILSVNGSYQSPMAMKTLLCTTADDLSSSIQGCGRLNVYRAMAHALNDLSPP